MNDNEIIKYMQCVIGNEVSCSECTYQKVLPFPSCRRMCAKNALDLINRQKADIESLKHRKTELQIRNQELQHEKSEAIKEFAKRLKERLTGIGRSTTYGNFEYGTIKSYELDNLVKEMTEQTTFEKVEHNSLCETETYKGGV